jgi:hypothetical protein
MRLTVPAFTDLVERSAILDYIALKTEITPRYQRNAVLVSQAVAWNCATFDTFKPSRKS